MTVLTAVGPELAQLEREGLLRRTVVSAGTGGKLHLPDGRALLNFSSNDYLDLAQDPHVKQRAHEAIDRYGCGATASRLMSGTLPVHDELEAALARLTGCPGSSCPSPGYPGSQENAALVFGTGFAMNVGVLFALAGRDDVIFADRLSHASLIDGARLSGAALKRFAHNDAASLERLLSAAGSRGRRYIVCESVYSMDGDLAPLAELRAIADRYDAALIVDEAHAIGVRGQGGGLLREHGLGAEHGAELVAGTLGKALGSQGGFLTCAPQMRDYLVNRTRSFIYSTALAPACAAAAIGAIERIEGDPGLGERLLARARGFHSALLAEGLRMGEFHSQIIPVHVGDNRRALELAARLRERGLIATAVRPPTVPEGTARLRLSVTLAHLPEDLAWAAAQIGAAARDIGLTNTGLTNGDLANTGIA